MGARLTQLGHRLHLHATSKHGALGNIDRKYETIARAANKQANGITSRQNSFFYA